MAVNRESWSRISLTACLAKFGIKTKHMGRHKKCSCPLHAEKTPSFVIYEDKTFKCYGCGEFGDVVSFLMKYLGVPFKSAIQWLVDEMGLVIQESETFKPYSKRMAVPVDVLDLVISGVFESPCKDYILQRKIPIGKHISPIGYLSKVTGEKRVDKHVGRLMFLLNDAHGRMVGISSRCIVGESDGRKYINPSLEEGFVKDSFLYGLDLAGRSMMSKGYCYLVEGYLDCIGYQASGFSNVIASCGTSLTDCQAEIISSYCRMVLLHYDNDKQASRKSASMAISTLAKHGVSCRVYCEQSEFDPFDLYLQGSLGSCNFVDSTVFLDKYLCESIEGYSSVWTNNMKQQEILSFFTEKNNVFFSAKESSALLFWSKKASPFNDTKFTVGIDDYQILQDHFCEDAELSSIFDPSVTFRHPNLIKKVCDLIIEGLVPGEVDFAVRTKIFLSSRFKKKEIYAKRPKEAVRLESRPIADDVPF